MHARAYQRRWAVLVSSTDYMMQQVHSFDSVLHNRIEAQFYSKRISCKCLMEMHSEASQMVMLQTSYSSSQYVL